MINREMMITVNNNSEMTDIVNTYMENDMKRLKKICHKLWIGKVETYEYDELYDVACDCLIESIVSFDKTAAKFETFLTGNILRKTYTWIRDNRYRLKRNNLLTDKDGKLILDENGNPQIIMNVSLDVDTEEMKNVKENLPTREEHDDGEISLIMQEYLNSLSKLQRRILSYLSDGYSQEQIENILHINGSEYKDNLKAIVDEKNVKHIRSLL
jgi:RNA polymerase sigma factor (sigma-70 family)